MALTIYLEQFRSVKTGPSNRVRILMIQKIDLSAHFSFICLYFSGKGNNLVNQCCTE